MYDNKVFQTALFFSFLYHLILAPDFLHYKTHLCTEAKNYNLIN